MHPIIVQALHVKAFIINLRFADDTEGEVYFQDQLDCPIFHPLKDVKYFKKFTLHPDLHTTTWHNSADFAPEFLYDNIQISIE